ncbi:MAG: ethylbenzene dehydrogenase-related protein [Anaerolineae bacterium]
MKRSIVVVIVLLLLLTLGAVSVGSHTLYPLQEATYVGMNTCFNCHPGVGIGPSREDFEATLHPWKLRPKAEANIVADWTVGEDVRTTVIEGEERAFTLDDVDYVIGASGRGWKQRFIKVIDGTWRILPAQWNIATQEWVAYHPDTHSSPWTGRDYKVLCSGCHNTGVNVDDPEMNGGLGFVDFGVTCEACHGPGSEHVAGGFAGPPGNRKIVKTVSSETCARCHVRGKTKEGLYAVRYGWPEGFYPGSGVALEDVYDLDWSTGKWWYDNPEDETDPGHASGHHQQYMEWDKSAHARALEDLVALPFAQDFCLQCHSEDYRRAPEDAKPTLATAEFSIECVTCHTTHDTGTGDHQLSLSAYDTCVQCHNGTVGGAVPIALGDEVHHPHQEMFEGIGFPGIADIPSRHFSQAESGPVCSNCHFTPTAKSAVPGDIASHLLKPVKPGDAKEGEANSCSSCHTDEAVGNEWLQNVIDRRQAAVTTELGVIQTWLDANQAISDTVEYQTAFTGHSMVEADHSMGIHNFAYAKAILAAAEAAIGSPNVLEAVKVSSPPTLDGDASDAAWTEATEMDAPSLDLKMKAVYTDQDFYMLVTWNDATASFTRGGSWSWDGSAWVKSAGQSEDRVAILWDINASGWAAEGCGAKCHPGANEPGVGDDAWLASGKADMWHMKAARSLPAISASQDGAVTVDPATHEVTAGTLRFDGYLDDEWVGQYDEPPDGGRHGDAGSSTYGRNRSADKTSPKYIETAPTDFMDAMVLSQSEIDAGETVEVSTLTPEDIATYWANYAALNAVVPERILRTPTDSRADVRQAAVWKDGVWTLEYKRALDTGNPDDDVIFSDLTQSYGFGVATMDNAGGGTHKDVGTKFSLMFKAMPKVYLPMIMKKWGP